MHFTHVYSLALAELCTASALISIGTVLGKANPVQLTLMALLEVTGFVLNDWLLRSLLRVCVLVFPISPFSTVLLMGSVKVLSLTAGAAPEQHHAASYFWALFWTRAHLDPVSEGVGAAI